MARCRHNDVGWLNAWGGLAGEFAPPSHLHCFDCGATLPFGAARGERQKHIAVEIRAAEMAQLAAEWKTHPNAETATAMTNLGGPKTLAAVLARQIWDHDNLVRRS